MLVFPASFVFAGRVSVVIAAVSERGRSPAGLARAMEIQFPSVAGAFVAISPVASSGFGAGLGAAVG